jgi:hypothetical protein
VERCAATGTRFLPQNGHLTHDSRRLAGILLIVLPSVMWGGVTLLALGFFLSVVSPAAEQPNALISLTYAGAVVLAIGVLVLGVGLVRRRPAGG